MAAISTYQTYLMHNTAASGSTASWEKLCDITSYPDLEGDPERIDVTTLSDAYRTYILGVQDRQNQDFNANYDHTVYTTIKGLKGTQHDYAVWFGATGNPGSEVPSGTYGKFSWTGDINVRLVGGGVNEARTMVITVTPSTALVDETT